ncbi:HAD family hydrolase [Paenibacillus sp. FSL H8-0034]|uniref:HAD family hydrolase n=1 Tax=Paenibacillus sp. FSL H8-0034 TaxID=2954671 RepID=UPI0030FCE092
MEVIKKNLREINTLLFDLDGTLLDSREFLMNIQFTALDKHYPGQYSYELIVENFGNVFHELLLSIDPDGNRVVADEFCLEKLNGYHKSSPPFPGVIPGLQALKNRGFKLGVVTNQQREPVNNALQAYGMAELFEVIIAIEDVSKGKPSPEGIADALQHIGTDPDCAAMVGDTNVDLLAAQNAGILSVLLAWYEDKDTSLYKPDLTCSSFKQLLEIFIDDTQDNQPNMRIEKLGGD